jgi:replicative DNA helicase
MIFAVEHRAVQLAQGRLEISEQRPKRQRVHQPENYQQPGATDHACCGGVKVGSRRRIARLSGPNRVQSDAEQRKSSPARGDEHRALWAVRKGRRRPTAPRLVSNCGISRGKDPGVDQVAPPHNLEAEKSVLGAVLLDERHLDALTVDTGLRPEHFYREGYGKVFAAMLVLHARARRIDHLTVAEELREAGALDELGGPAAIEELTAWVPTTGNAREYGRIVRETAQLRDLMRQAHEILASVRGRDAPAAELVERAERAILEVAHDDRRKAVSTIEEALDAELEQIQARTDAKSPLTGTPSGFRDLDQMTGGFQPGSLTVLEARPGMGKSALVVNIAEAAALAGHGVLLFSLEMSESELCQRLVASMAHVPGEHLRRGKVTPQEWPRIIDACGRLSATGMFLDDSGDTGILEIRAKARRLHQQRVGGLGLIIVDYLQLMRPDERVQNRVEQVGQMSRGLKTLAKELAVPVIALSQLSRAVEQRAEKKPLLSDLRESGQIEADADLIMFIYREDRNIEHSERPGEADIIIAKHRSGPLGEIKLAFQEQFPRFMTYSSDRFNG